MNVWNMLKKMLPFFGTRFLLRMSSGLIRTSASSEKAEKKWMREWRLEGYLKSGVHLQSWAQCGYEPRLVRRIQSEAEFVGDAVPKIVEHLQGGQIVSVEQVKSNAQDGHVPKSRTQVFASWKTWKRRKGQLEKAGRRRVGFEDDYVRLGAIQTTNDEAEINVGDRFVWQSKPPPAVFAISRYSSAHPTFGDQFARTIAAASCCQYAGRIGRTSPIGSASSPS
jgi:hypothetical protein